MNASQLINQTSGDVEYYTPGAITEAARLTMGGIDLDPASSEVANQRVCASKILTADENGLRLDWHGRVWLNHPFGRAEKPCPIGCTKQHTHHSYELYGNRAWIKKLMAEYATGRTWQACCITFACTSEDWFQPLLKFPQCYLSPRTNYLTPDGRIKQGVSKGSVVTYLGERVAEFARHFSPLGVIKVEYKPEQLKGHQAEQFGLLARARA